MFVGSESLSTSLSELVSAVAVHWKAASARCWAGDALHGDDTYRTSLQYGHRQTSQLSTGPSNDTRQHHSAGGVARHCSCRSWIDVTNSHRMRPRSTLAVRICAPTTTCWLAIAEQHTGLRRVEQTVLIHTVSGKKVNHCIHFHNSGKQCWILAKFCSNNAVSNCKQTARFQ